MKRFTMLGAVALAALSLAACDQVPAAHVGIRIAQFGSHPGVQPDIIQPSTFMHPWGTKIVIFPTTNQNYTFTQGSAEGNAVNEEFTFNDSAGVVMKADIGITWSVMPDKAPMLYGKTGTSDIKALEGTQIRNSIRNALNNEAAHYQVSDIMSDKKQELLKKVAADVRADLEANYGINVVELYWVSNIRPPDSIQQQINNKLANQQQALAAAAAVATATANAQAKVAEAKGTADANALLAQSVNTSPELMKLKAIERWNGQLPTYMGGNSPLPFLDLK